MAVGRLAAGVGETIVSDRAKRIDQAAMKSVPEKRKRPASYALKDQPLFA